MGTLNKNCEMSFQKNICQNLGLTIGLTVIKYPN